MKNILIGVAVATLMGCAGETSYVRPVASATAANIKSVDRPREAVWNSSVPELGKQFFVINNLDKSSGLINISYTGDPEKYVDCGQITSYVKNARGERTYEFPGARAQQNYEIMESGNLFEVQRRMSLEGRVNLIFEEVGPAQTRVTANTRYVLTKLATVRNIASEYPQNFTETIAFNSSGSASFAPNAKGDATQCVSTGQMESDVLSAIR